MGLPRHNLIHMPCPSGYLPRGTVYFCLSSQMIMVPKGGGWVKR
jgi:hypothetical protein